MCKPPELAHARAVVFGSASSLVGMCAFSSLWLIYRCARAEESESRRGRFMDDESVEEGPSTSTRFAGACVSGYSVSLHQLAVQQTHQRQRHALLKKHGHPSDPLQVKSWVLCSSAHLYSASSLEGSSTAGRTPLRYNIQRSVSLRFFHEAIREKGTKDGRVVRAGAYLHSN